MDIKAVVTQRGWRRLQRHRENRQSIRRHFIKDDANFWTDIIFIISLSLSFYILFDHSRDFWCCRNIRKSWPLNILLIEILFFCFTPIVFPKYGDANFCTQLSLTHLTFWFDVIHLEIVSKTFFSCRCVVQLAYFIQGWCSVPSCLAALRLRRWSAHQLIPPQHPMQYCKHCLWVLFVTKHPWFTSQYVWNYYANVIILNIFWTPWSSWPITTHAERTLSEDHSYFRLFRGTVKTKKKNKEMAVWWYNAAHGLFFEWVGFWNRMQNVYKQKYNFKIFSQPRNKTTFLLNKLIRSFVRITCKNVNGFWYYSQGRPLNGISHPWCTLVLTSDFTGPSTLVLGTLFELGSLPDLEKHVKAHRHA